MAGSARSKFQKKLFQNISDICLRLNSQIHISNTDSMPEVTITYKNSKTLKILEQLATLLNFSISTRNKKNAKPAVMIVNGVTIVTGKRTANEQDNREMNEIITKNKIDAKQLRQKWQRTK